jgi:hypothetical protein
VNIAVTTNYYKNDVSFQDGLDRLQFAWMLLVAWVGLLSMVAKAGYDLSQKNDNPQTLITDFSTPNVIGNANEDLTTHDLAGKEIATTGFPHNRFTFESALLLQNVGLFAENWDAIAADPKRKILESMASGNLQIPTGETIPTRRQFLIATTNHPETDELQNFVHHAFSLVVPWRHQDDMLIVLFKEIQEACQRVAMAQGYDLVLHYNDATTSQEYWSAMNIARKLQAGACMPLHYGPGVEITNEVVNALNSAFTRTAPGAATGGAPAAAPGVTTGGAGAPRP